MHWGFYHRHVPHIPGVELHIASDYLLKTILQRNDYGIPMPSRNFLPSCFHPDSNVHKIWDILAIQRPVRFKNIDQLLQSLRLVYDRRPQTKTLIFTFEPEQLDPHFHYVELQQDYERLFTAQERENLQLKRVVAKPGEVFPLQEAEIADLYRQSRIFTLFSDAEGESRVISEALVSGLYVVAKKHLKGGGRDYLDEDNSRLFTTPEQAATCFIELMEKHRPPHNVKQMITGMRQDHTVARFEQELRQFFATIDEPFEGALKLDNLHRNLPSQNALLPRTWTVDGQDDLRSLATFVEFARHLTGQPTLSKWQLKITELNSKLTSIRVRTKQRISRLIRGRPKSAWK